MNSYESILKKLKERDSITDWDNLYLLMENTLDGTFFNKEKISRDDYYMLINRNGTLNYLAFKNEKYSPLFTLTIEHEEKIVMVFGFEKVQEVGNGTRL